MQLWDDLVSTALVGTDRQSVELPSGASPLMELFGGIEGKAPAQKLLAAAGTVAWYRQVGQLPSRESESSVTLCEPDELPVCSYRAGEQFLAMLGGQHSEVLPEWLSLMTTHGKRVPPRHLPALLEYGRQHQELRDAILPVLGKRGIWLAGYNPNWSYVLDRSESQPDEQIWETGNREARQVVLQRLRDKDPAKARKLVASSWAQDPAEQRALWLATFETGLSLDDEPLLESALDDRRKEVRVKAAELLQRLSGSQLQQRMLDRVRPLISIQREDKPKLHVTLPQECDKAMVRDGIEPKPPHSQIGEKAWWLGQMLKSVPPALWCQTLAVSPEVLLLLAKKSDWEDLLIEGWLVAATRHRDSRWTATLFDQAGKLPQKWNYLLTELLRTLTPAFREQYVTERLKSGNEALQGSGFLFDVLRNCDHAWNPELSASFVRCLRVTVATKPNHWDWGLVHELKSFAVRLSPDCLAETVLDWPADRTELGRWSEAIERFLAVAQFRLEMCQEMNLL